MIALCHAKCCVVHLKADGQEYVSHSAQHGVKGNLIVYPQTPSDIAKKLPPSIEDIASPICVLFIGSHPPSNEWLRDKAKPLAVRGSKVRQALLWLKHNNHLYVTRHAVPIPTVVGRCAYAPIPSVHLRLPSEHPERRSTI